MLRGGILLAAFGERRPTRDVDLQVQDLDNDADEVRSAVCEIASIELDDGIIFDVDAASAEVIRDEDAYAGMRVSMSAQRSFGVGPALPRTWTSPLPPTATTRRASPARCRRWA